MSERHTKSALIELINVSKVYGINHRSTTAINNVSFQAFPGELILLLGPSGSGKTTLLTLIAGLLQPTTGIIRLFNKSVECYDKTSLQLIRASKIGFVFQTFQLIDALTAEENIMLGLQFAGNKRKKSKRKVQEIFDLLNISHLAYKLPTEMSHGEKQRVAIARAITNNPDLIIADEPTANLESSQGFEIIRLLREYASKNDTCVIVASHDLRLTEYADCTLYLKDGKVENKVYN